MLKFFLYMPVLVLFTSCGSLWVKTAHYTTTKGEVTIGTIGQTQLKGFHKVFSSEGVPTYKEGILLSVEQQNFSKPSFKKYVKACESQGKPILATYVDSLPEKPVFIQVRLADEVKVTEQLYSDQNPKIIQHLKNFPEDKMVSEVLVYFPESLTQALLKADEVFLLNTSYKQYQLALYSHGKLNTTLSFSEGVAFAYRTSEFCWVETQNRVYQISGLKSKKEECPAGQFDSHLKAVKHEKKDIF